MLMRRNRMMKTLRTGSIAIESAVRILRREVTRRKSRRTRRARRTRTTLVDWPVGATEARLMPTMKTSSRFQGFRKKGTHQ
jgi:hypothetical protein